MHTKQGCRCVKLCIIQSIGNARERINTGFSQASDRVERRHAAVLLCVAIAVQREDMPWPS